MKKSENIKQERLTHTDINQAPDIFQSNENLTQEVPNKQLLVEQQKPIVAPEDYLLVDETNHLNTAADSKYPHEYTYALNTDVAVASDVTEQAIIAGEVDVLPVAGVAESSSFSWMTAVGVALATVGAVGVASAAGGGSSSGEHSTDTTNTVDKSNTVAEVGTINTIPETSVATATTENGLTSAGAASSTAAEDAPVVETVKGSTDALTTASEVATVVQQTQTASASQTSVESATPVTAVATESVQVASAVNNSDTAVTETAGSPIQTTASEVATVVQQTQTASASQTSVESATPVTAVATESVQVASTVNNSGTAVTETAGSPIQTTTLAEDAPIVAVTTVESAQINTNTHNETNVVAGLATASDNSTTTAPSNAPSVATTAVDSAQSTTTTNNQTNTAAGEAAVVSDVVSTSPVSTTAVIAADEQSMTTGTTATTSPVTSEITPSSATSETDKNQVTSSSTENTASSAVVSAPTTDAIVVVSNTTPSAVNSQPVDTTSTTTSTANSTTASETTAVATNSTTANSDTSAAQALTSTGTTTLSTEAQYIASHIPSTASYVVVSSLSGAASAIAANSKLTHVLISDGEHFALFAKGNTSGDVTQSWGGSTWGAKFTDGYVPLSAFVSSGTSGDVTTAFQKAADLASKLHVGVEFPNEGNYTLKGTILINGGVSFVHGNDSHISVSAVSSGRPYSIRLGGADVSTHTELSDLTIDMNGLKNTSAIYGSDVQGAYVHNLTIVDASYNGMFFTTTSSSLHNITLADNNIKLNWSASASDNHYYGINISNILDISSKYSSYALPIWQQYVETGTVPKSLYDVSGIKITGNQIDGGYYGISFSGVSDSEISNNLITNNVRNISIQNNSNNNKVFDNYLTGQDSSAVHLAYNSDGNTVSKNTIVSNTSYRQAFLQAYQDSDDNTFSSNTIEVLGSNMPGWALYSGTDSSGTSFISNVVSGNIRKTVIGVEPVWDYYSANAQGTQRAALMSSLVVGSNGEKVPYDGGVGSISDITVYANIIDSGYKYASIVYAGADVSNGYDGKQSIVGNINNLAVNHNVVFGTSGTDFTDVLRTHENGASITNVTSSSNAVLDGTHADTFTGTSSKNTFFVDSIHDKMTDSSDTDSDQVYSSVSYTLPEHVENITLIGSAALNATGNSGNNVLTGNGYDNVLNGGAGNDTLIGGWGHDTLTGGSGADVFLFNSVLRSDSVDKITDFTVGTDKIGLSSVIFGSHEGTDWFAASASAVNSHTVVYQDGNKLFYDADGSGSYFSPIEFAELNTSTPLSVTSFQIL